MGVVALIAYVALPVAAEETRADLAEAGPPAPSWCASTLEPLGGDCFAAPRDAQEPVPLVVYLHGRYCDETAREELDRQARLARLATERGFAVLALHGVRGECNSSDYKSWYCWPSNERNASDAPAFVARVTASIARARARLGPGRDVLLGFSNGGYFASLIATRGLARFDAVAVAHGGPVGAVDALATVARGASGFGPPMLLVTSDDDAADPEMRKLDAQLSFVHWPHALVSREGGHSLPDWDLDAALTFFDRTGREGFPLVPPLASRSRRAVTVVVASDESDSVEDGGAEIPVDGGADLGDL